MRISDFRPQRGSDLRLLGHRASKRYSELQFSIEF